LDDSPVRGKKLRDLEQNPSETTLNAFAEHVASLPMLIPCLPLFDAVASPASESLPDAGRLGQDFLHLAGQAAGGVLLWIVVSQLLILVAYWIASNVVAHSQGRISNAIKLHFLYLLSFFGISLLFSALLFVAGQNQAVVFAGACVAGLLVAVVVFGLPMKVYKMGFFAALGFILITLMLTAAGGLGATRFLEAPSHLRELAQISQKIARLPVADRQRFLERLAGRTTDSGDELLAADRSKPIAERFAAVSRIYASLEERRTKLQPGDEAGKMAYARDEKHYEDLLAKIQADAAAESDKP
jgi:hypothetical protein